MSPPLRVDFFSTHDARDIAAVLRDQIRSFETPRAIGTRWIVQMNDVIVLAEPVLARPHHRRASFVQASAHDLQGLGFELRIVDPFRGQRDQFGPIELKRQTELHTHGSVFVVVHLAAKRSVLEDQWSELFDYRRTFEAYVLGRRMMKCRIAAALRDFADAHQLAELLGIDLLAHVIEEENLKRTGEGRTGHPVPIIAGIGASVPRKREL